MEILRRTVRQVISTNSWFYKSCAAAVDFASIIRRCGLGTYFKLSRAQQPKNQGGAPISLSFDNLLHPIIIRPGTDDAQTIINNIVREEWGNFQPDQEPVWMIDGGAYIGDSTAYFLSRFPTLRVIALEPDTLTFQTMAKNLEPYENRVRIINSGLYTHEGKVHFQSGQTAGSIAADGDSEIAVTTLEALLAGDSISRLDILKLDIEGAEEVIFSESPEKWLKQVEWLIIEFHSDQGESTISRILRQNGFTMRQYRSVWYCHNGAFQSNGHPSDR